jgi:hypothetical protein
MKRALATAFVLAIIACKAEQPAAVEAPAPAPPPPLPTVEQAHELIASSPAFGEHQFTNAGWSVVVAGSQMNEPSRQAAKDLAAEGWIAFDGAGSIQLTDKSRNDKRFIMRPNGILDIVPLAKKEMGGVEEVRPGPDGGAVAWFTWRWIPNEVGASFKSGMLADRFAAPQRSMATMVWNGTGWEVVGVEE